MLKNFRYVRWWLGGAGGKEELHNQISKVADMDFFFE